MRLDKFLSDMGVGTRNELKKDIKAGLVTVDGSVVRDPGAKVSGDSEVRFRGLPVAYEEFVYYMLNKPAGVISASDDPRESTVVDLITGYRRKDLFPVGRLDRDTEGLLLITNNGQMAHRLLSPKHHVDKIYYACVSGAVTPDDVIAFSEGLVLEDGLECLPAELNVLNINSDNGESVSETEVTIREGKFHQIKRMFHALGHEVLYLRRLSMGPLELDGSLEPGEFRRLTDEEIKSLEEL
ncbi:MAG: rRNA pseudouridine synthase [Mogibacterium sp.]|nr:rRNA pseudouridine synthase [Mogibacterium sp.]